MTTLELRTLVILLGVVSLAFALVLWPFAASLFWSLVTAIVFTPLYRRFASGFGGRSTIAAIATVVVILVAVILPILFIVLSLVREATGLYESVRSQPMDLIGLVQPVIDRTPDWMRRVLDGAGLSDLSAIRDQLAMRFTDGVQLLAARAFDVGQSTFGFVVGLGVMLYVLFFLLRDGTALSRRFGDAIPLRQDLREILLQSFVSTIRATVVGDLFVAAVQGALGGLIFWILGIHAPLLWAVLMAILSLLPAIGAALVWLPVAIYFLTTGAIWEGIVLAAYGVLVIGLVDNLLRPILVGNATKLPDYLVLVSTLGGIEVFGLQGFIVGPVVAALFLSLWTQWSAMREEQDHAARLSTPLPDGPHPA